MRSQAADLARLSVLVQRLLDAELLLDAQGAALLAEAEEARRLSQEGSEAAACRHVERLVLLTEALVSARALDLADGRAVIETARRILAADAD